MCSREKNCGYHDTSVQHFPRNDGRSGSMGSKSVQMTAHKLASTRIRILERAMQRELAEQTVQTRILPVRLVEDTIT
jgi:hypothetical protein